MTGLAGQQFISGFVGRRAEVDALKTVLATWRLASVVGPGGNGKTRLGYEVFDILSADFDGLAWVVELADLAEPELLGHMVASAMGVAVMSTSLDLQVLVDHIGDRPALLFLDNCEHLVDTCARFVDVLLRSCPGLRVMVTSRQSLGVPGERLYPVAGLRPTDAVTLFNERARAIVPTWQPPDADSAAIADLCQALEGSPLAIELAAAQIRLFTPAMMLEILSADSRSTGLFDERLRSRQSSLDACMAWSYDLCTPSESSLWLRLSVFAGGFSLEAAEEVCAGEGLDRAAVLPALSGLLDKSLVERDLNAPHGHYRLHEIVRQFGQARLIASGAHDRWRRRHRDYYFGLAKRFDAVWIGPDQHTWIERLRRENANLGKAFDFSVASSDEAPVAMQMAALLEPYYACSDSLGIVLHWLRLALSYDSGTGQERAEALRFGCHMATILTDQVVAERMYAEVTRLAANSDDIRVHASASYAATVYLRFKRDATAAVVAGERGIELLAQIGDVNRQVYLYYLLGKAYSALGDFDAAGTTYRSCLQLALPLGERWMSSYAIFGLGQDALAQGKLDEAIQLLRDAMRVKAEFRDHLALGFIIETLGWAAAAREDCGLAAFLIGAADAIWNSLGTSVVDMPYLAERRAESIAASRRDLPAEEYQRLHDAGSTVAFEVAVKVALGEAAIPGPTGGRELTRREYEIATLVCSGATNRAIAEKLVLSVRTVESHVERILRKTGVRSRTELSSALTIKP